MNPWNVSDEFKHLELEALKSTQYSKTLPFAVCVLNLNGDLNVGMIMRSAVLVGAERFFIFGRRCYDRRSTVGAQNYIEVIREYGVDENGEYDVEAFYKMIGDYTPVFIEQGGVNLKNHLPSARNCYIFGNEGTGIPENLMKQHERVSLSQRGILRSYNVSAAASIVLYHVMENL